MDSDLFWSRSENLWLTFIIGLNPRCHIFTPSPSLFSNDRTNLHELTGMGRMVRFQTTILQHRELAGPKSEHRNHD